MAGRSVRWPVGLGLAGLVLSLAVTPSCGDDHRSHTDPGDASVANVDGGGSDVAGFGGTTEVGAGGAPSPPGGAGQGGVGGSSSGGAGGARTGVCGDGLVTTGEACEGDDTRGTTCADLGFTGGELTCSPSICRFDTSDCQSDLTPTCEQAPIELTDACRSSLCSCGRAVDDCEGACWDEVECIYERCGDVAFLDCAECPTPSDEAVAMLVCLGNRECSRCGNGTREFWEVCEGEDLDGTTCEDLGKKSGELRCFPSCTLDARGCDAAECGDGVAGLGEDCDGTDLRDATCESLGYPSGVLRCIADTCRLDESGCKQCGDGRLQEGEECDQTAFGGMSCARRGFAGGTLSCTADCKIDDSECSRCGNGVVEPGENCDGTDSRGVTCRSLGFASGSPSCKPTTCRIDISACEGANPGCGNEIAELGEECDNEDLTGLSCQDLGFPGGSLSCNENCRLDTSRCDPKETQNACKSCRDSKCRSSQVRCDDNPGCAAFLKCAKQCSLPDETCWFGCAGTIEPSVALEALAAGVAHFSCVSAQCGNDCAGELQ